MDQIRQTGGYQGAKLHKVEERKSTQTAPQQQGLTALLEDAFVKIKSASAMSSDEDSDSSEDWSETEC